MFIVLANELQLLPKCTAVAVAVAVADADADTAVRAETFENSVGR